MNKLLTMFSFNIHGPFSYLIKGLDLKKSHLFLDVAKQLNGVLHYHLIPIKLIETQLDVCTYELNKLILNSLSMSMFEMEPVEFLVFFIPRSTELALSKCLELSSECATYFCLVKNLYYHRISHHGHSYLSISSYRK